MKKSNMYIQKMFINLMNNLCYEFSCIYLHNAILANALYTNYDLIESDLTNSFPKNVPFPFC